MGSFFDDTRPSSVGPGHFRCDLGEDWKAFYAFGGATLAAVIRATDAHVDEADLGPVSLHAVFLEPVDVGVQDIHVETLRPGRGVQQVSAALLSPSGTPAIRMLGTWGTRQPDIVTATGLVAPDVPGPDDPTVSSPDHDPRFDHLPVNGQFDERLCPGHARPGSLLDPDLDAESAFWTRLAPRHGTSSRPYDPSLVALYGDRVPGPHLGRTFSAPDDDIPARPIVTLDLGIRYFAPPTSDWLLLHGRIASAADRYVAVDAAVWDEDRALVATVDQTARFASTPVQAPGAGP